jgi:hypothetical protein
MELILVHGLLMERGAGLGQEAQVGEVGGGEQEASVGLEELRKLAKDLREGALEVTALAQLREEAVKEADEANRTHHGDGRRSIRGGGNHATSPTCGQPETAVRKPLKGYRIHVYHRKGGMTMLRPSDLVGRQFLVKAQTPMGVYQRLIKAFDAQDARDQMMAYLTSEGIPYRDVTIQPF